MEQVDLDTFVRVISWQQGEGLLDVFRAYAELLAGRLAETCALGGSGEVTQLAASVAGLEERLPEGLLVALTWPPVSAVLLGRSPEGLEGRVVLRRLMSAPIQPLRSDPQALREPDWLAAHGPGEGPSMTEWSFAERRLGSAWALLGRFGGHIASFVRVCTRVVVFRSAAGTGIGSWSTDELIGCSVLVNAHSANVDDAFLAECLVHEAVHHYQGMFESVRASIRDPSLVGGPERYESPWSGGKLTAKSLLAACFVWFSLAHLWDRAGGVVDPVTRAKYLRRATQGFIVGDPASLVAEFAWALDPELTRTVSSMQDTVRRRWCA